MTVGLCFLLAVVGGSALAEHGGYGGYFSTRLRPGRGDRNHLDTLRRLPASSIDSRKADLARAV